MSDSTPHPIMTAQMIDAWVRNNMSLVIERYRFSVLSMRDASDSGGFHQVIYGNGRFKLDIAVERGVPDFVISRLSQSTYGFTLPLLVSYIRREYHGFIYDGSIESMLQQLAQDLESCAPQIFSELFLVTHEPEIIRFREKWARAGFFGRQQRRFIQVTTLHDYAGAACQ